MSSVFKLSPTKIELIIPKEDETEPTVTVLVPVMNEEFTIATFCQWCHEGFKRAGVTGEILLIDSSDDTTPEIALANGARVLRVPRNGIGRAYQDALQHIRGQYVVLGDADCTYDFRELGTFVSKLQEGFDLVMGTRFRGKMERGAMPLHHKYFGSPLTTILADVLLGLRLSDIHCGMRGMTKKSLIDLDLKSDGWEYASEMIVNSVRKNYRITEIAIPFFKDVEGRISHVKRQGWMTPFRAGWRTVNVLLTNAADFFLVKPGILLSVLGTILLLILSNGPVSIFSTTFTLNTMVFGLGIAGLGYFMTSFGVVTRCIYDRTHITVRKWSQILTFNRVMPPCITVVLVGVFPIWKFVSNWLSNDRMIEFSDQHIQHLAIASMGAILLVSAVFVTMLTVGVLASDVKNHD